MCFINELLNIARPPDTPWILGGDFNLIRWIIDRPNCLPNWALMDSFNDSIRQMQLFDVPLQGRKFTWSNKQPNPNFSKIDRIFLTPALLTAFQQIKLSPGAMLTSDHVPLLLTCAQNAPTKSPKRIELFWMQYKAFKDITIQSFTPPDDSVRMDPITAFSSKLSLFHHNLRQWHNHQFRDHDTYLDNCAMLVSFFDSLEELRPLTGLEIFIRIKTRERAYEIANIEEIRWHQRARCRWLTCGDRNTNFFHALASSRARTKRVVCLQHQGIEITSQQEIMSAFLQHYKDLLGTRQQQTWIDLSTLYEPSSNLCQLASPFTEEEVLHAIKNLAPNKASGPDGLPNEFLRQYSDSLKPFLMNIVNNFAMEKLT